MSKGAEDDVVFPEECYSVRPRSLSSVSPVLKFRYSSTKYHMSALLSSDVIFPRQHAYYPYAVVGFSHKSTPRCITAVPELQEPVYGV